MIYTELSQLPDEEVAQWESAPIMEDGRRDVEILGVSEAMSLKLFLQRVSERLDGWRKGFYSKQELALLLACRISNGDAKTLKEQITQATLAGALVLRKNGIPLKAPDLARKDTYAARFRLDDINKWLGSIGAGYELAYPYSDHEQSLANELEDTPPTDCIPFNDAAALLFEKYGATEFELAAWLTFERHDLGSWIISRRGDGKTYGRHFGDQDLRVPDPLRPELQPALPSTAARVIGLIKALDVQLSAAQVHNFVVTDDLRFLDFKGAHALILSRCSDVRKVADILNTWRAIHNKLRSFKDAPDKVGAFLPFACFADNVEDGLVMRAPMEAFLDRQLGKLAVNRPDNKSSAPAPVAKHKIKGRSNPLDAVIGQAMKAANTESEWQPIWAELIRTAEGKNPPAPLIGYVENEGIKYRSDANDEGVKFLTKKALAARIKRKSTPQ